MKDKDKEFKSLNKETGMLEDIDEVRKVGVMLAGILQTVLLSPFVRLTMPPGMYLDTVTTAILGESLLRTISEADAVRLLSGLLGSGPLEAEAQIRRFGLSEKLPPTHPNSITNQTQFPPLDPNDQLVKDSEMLQRVIELSKEKHDERVELPASVENFLKELQQEDKQEGL